MPKKKSKKSSETIYLKFDYDEAINSKKESLFLQVSLVKIMRIMRKYKKLRKEELKLKIQLYNNLKKLKASINRINRSFPKVKTPSFLEEDEESEKTKEKKSKGKKQTTKKERTPEISSDLERELEKIHGKIQELSSKQ